MSGTSTLRSTNFAIPAQQSPPYYQAGKVYDIRGGATSEDLFNKLKISIPVEEGFITHPDRAKNAIMYTNLTKCPFTFSLFEARKDKTNQDNWDPNHQIDEVTLDPGESSHSPLPPVGFIVSLDVTIDQQHGQARWFSAEGFRMEHLSGYTFTINSRDNFESFTVDINKNNTNNPFAVFNNQSTKDIKIFITRPKTAYPLSNEEEDRLLGARDPDPGHDVFDQDLIKQGEVLRLIIPARKFWVNVTEPKDVSKGTGLRLFSRTSQVQQEYDSKDFVSAAGSWTYRGQCAILTLGNGITDGVRLEVIDSSKVRFVSGKIVVNDSIVLH